MTPNHLGLLTWQSWLEDYPAAHSMDTTWFAVDAVGNVAVFETGENGHIPRDASDEISLYEVERLHRAVAEDEDYHPPEELAERFGLFLFDFPSIMAEIAPAYERTTVPKRPAHVDQLPPELREAAKRLRFPGRFSDLPRVQPIEQYACQFWYEGDTCYLLADGKTVRPFPGKESEFEQFVLDLRQNDPDEAARYIFEGIDDGE